MHINCVKMWLYAASESILRVYFTPDISAAGLVTIYQAIDYAAHGNVAVKVSPGESGGHNFLQPELIADLERKVDGTIVECRVYAEVPPRVKYSLPEIGESLRPIMDAIWKWGESYQAKAR